MGEKKWKSVSYVEVRNCFLGLCPELSWAAHGSKVWGEVAVPEDMESHAGGRRWEKYLVESDDEDFAADEASGGMKSFLSKC
ncbi:UNVERIFIED_CONTAM: hypothetical protein FKN15_057919 [Acipenser sinensis]